MKGLHVDDIPFIVTDVETTGTNPRDNRVIEVACVVVQGGEVLEEYSSLVNPGQHIPSFIANMTGISNAMVYNAPSPEEVFRPVSRLLTLPNAIFVAHNVTFDWSFIAHSLVRCGFAVPEDIPRLCTYKMARRLLPRHTKFNLGALSAHFNINIRDRHRAGGDASATAALLNRLLGILEDTHGVGMAEDLLMFQNRRLQNFKSVPSYIRKMQDTLARLPNEPGVYFFRGASEEILYIGKAKSLRDRVQSYFQQGATHTKKIQELVRQVQKITWECTGTELSALLLESREIKAHKPRYNTMIKRYRRYPFLRLSACTFPRLEWCDEIEEDGAEYFGPFGSRSSVESILDTINRTFRLRECAGTLQPHKDNTPCFYYQIQRCDAPCAQSQSPEEYAVEVDRVRGFLSGRREGILAVLRQAMDESAQRLDFEEAIILRNRMRELERVFFRQAQIAASVNSHNLIIAVPVSEGGAVEVFFVRFGRLLYQRTVTRQTPRREFERQITKIYFSGEVAPRHCRKEEIDEIRIIAGWLHRHRDDGKFLYINGLTYEEVVQRTVALVQQAADKQPVQQLPEELPLS